MLLFRPCTNPSQSEGRERWWKGTSGWVSITRFTSHCGSASSTPTDGSQTDVMRLEASQAARARSDRRARSSLRAGGRSRLRHRLPLRPAAVVTGRSDVPFPRMRSPCARRSRLPRERGLDALERSTGVNRHAKSLAIRVLRGDPAHYVAPFVRSAEAWNIFAQRAGRRQGGPQGHATAACRPDPARELPPW